MSEPDAGESQLELADKGEGEPDKYNWRKDLIRNVFWDVGVVIGVAGLLAAKSYAFRLLNIADMTGVDRYTVLVFDWALNIGVGLNALWMVAADQIAAWKRFRKHMGTGSSGSS